MSFGRVAGVLTALSLLAGLVAATALHPTPTNADVGDWSSFRRGPERSGFNGDTVGLTLPLDQRWTFPLPEGNQGYMSPIVANGRVYAVDVNGRLYALNPSTGAQLWAYQSPSRIASTPSADASRLFFGTIDGQVVALDQSNGQLAWTYQAAGSVVGSPAVVSNRVCVSTSSGRIYCLNRETGSLLWSFVATSGGAIAAPTASIDTVYLATLGGRVHAIDAATGIQKWSYLANGPVHTTPALLGSALYFATDNGTVYALNTVNGSVLWQQARPGDPITSIPNDPSAQHYGALQATTTAVVASPAVGYGNVYVASINGEVIAYSAGTGAQVWQTTVAGAVYGSPALASGYLFVASYGGTFSVLDAQTGGLQWSASVGATQSSPVVAGTSVFLQGAGNVLRAYLQAPPTPTATPTGSATSTPTPTSTPALTPASTNTPTPTNTPVGTPPATPTATATPIGSGLGVSVNVGASPVALDYSATSGRLYVANQGSNSVSVIDLRTDAVVATVNVGVGPSGVWADPDGNVYVANQGSANVSVIKAGSNVASDPISVESLPVAVAGSRVTNNVYVANQGSNSVSVINAATGTVSETIPVGTGPSAVAVHPDTNVVYVANQGSNSVTVINGFSNLPITTIQVGAGPTGLAVNGATKRLYVANNQGSSITVIDTETNVVLATVPLPAAPRSLAVFEPANLVFATHRLTDQATVLDAATNTVLGTMATGDAPMGVRVWAAAAAVYVANSGAGTVSLLPVVPVAGPRPASPENGATLSGLQADLRWGEVRGATQYHLQVTPFNNDGPGVNLIRNIGTSFTVPAPAFGTGNYIMLGGMTYLWRVRVTYATTPLDENSPLWGPWSEQFRFKTPAPNPDDVRLVDPPDGAAVASLTPTLVWGNQDPTVFYYEVQVSKDPGFGPNAPLYFELRHGALSTPPNSYTIPSALPLEPQSLYYWRVRPRVQGDGTPVAWTPARSFLTP